MKKISNGLPMPLEGSNENRDETPTKEKKNWFHSLTRRKKAESKIENSGNEIAESAQVQNNNNNNNNNNEPTSPDEMLPNANIMNNTFEEANGVAANYDARKQKAKKNVFQCIRKTMEERLHALRYWRSSDDNEASGSNGTTDATYEFVRHANIDLSLPFSHDYKRYIAKKWLEGDNEPNPIMYKACSEMLNQVWYWGEISRRDAQKQLTDKPTGSFLVRDSEQQGNQFTLSFRIVNVTLHYRLEYRDGFWHFEELQFDSIAGMINDILYRCWNDNFVCFVKVPSEIQPPFPVILKYPLSRYLNIPKLQDLCRRSIQNFMTDEQILRLPVPPQMLEYLSVRRALLFQS